MDIQYNHIDGWKYKALERRSSMTVPRIDKRKAPPVIRCCYSAMLDNGTSQRLVIEMIEAVDHLLRLAEILESKEG